MPSFSLPNYSNLSFPNLANGNTRTNNLVEAYEKDPNLIKDVYLITHNNKTEDFTLHRGAIGFFRSISYKFTARFYPESSKKKSGEINKAIRQNIVVKLKKQPKETNLHFLVLAADHLNPETVFHFIKEKDTEIIEKNYERHAENFKQMQKEFNTLTKSLDNIDDRIKKYQEHLKRRVKRDFISDIPSSNEPNQKERINSIGTLSLLQQSVPKLEKDLEGFLREQKSMMDSINKLKNDYLTSLEKSRPDYARQVKEELNQTKSISQ
jgi:hypothetical protein